MKCCHNDSAARFRKNPLHSFGGQTGAMAKHQGMVDGAIASYNNLFDQEGGKVKV